MAFHLDPRPVRVVLVGSGFVAGMHLKALLGMDDAEIAGVVDLDAAKAAETARQAGGIDWSTDLDEALDQWSVDAAIVCTPNDTHLRIGLSLAARGVHALMEKPLATVPDEAGRLVDAYRSSGLVLSAAHTHRFGAYARAVKDSITEGDVGRPVHVRLSALNGWIWADWRGWQLDMERSGGHALHNGVHSLDLVTWWLDDEPTALHAIGRKQTAGQLDIYDYMMITVGYRSGATAVCEISRANRPRRFKYRDIFVQGTSGSLRIPWDADGPMLHSEAKTGPVGTVPQPFRDQARAWLAAVRGEPSASVTPEEGMRSVVMGVAAERSMDTGETVEMADVQGSVGNE